MTLTRHRLPADTAVLEPKMLLSSVVVGGVDADSVLVDGLSVVGVFLTEKPRDWAPHSFRVKTMVRFSPAGRERVIIVVIHAACFFIMAQVEELLH